MSKTWLYTSRLPVLSAGIGLLTAAVLMSLPGRETPESYIVQGDSLAQVKAAVMAVGGVVTHHEE